MTKQPRFSLGLLATLRLTFAHPYTTDAAQAPPNDAPTLSALTFVRITHQNTDIRPKTSVFSSPDLTQAIALYPEQTSAYLYLGDTLNNLKRFNEAIETYVEPSERC